MRTLLSLLVVALLAGACAKKAKPPETAPAPAETAPAPKQAPVEDASANMDPVVQKMAKNFKRLHFEFNLSTLNPESQTALSDNIAIMEQVTDVKVEVQGHADERGTSEYNLSLGQRRAEAVRKYIITSGIPKDRILTISYGEERPLEGGEGEIVWSKNRRAEFRVTRGKSEAKGTVAD